MSHASESPLPAVDEIGAEIMARAEALAAFNQGTEGVTRMFATFDPRRELDPHFLAHPGRVASNPPGGNPLFRAEH